MEDIIARRRENYDRLDMLAAMIEPLGAMLTDPDVRRAWREQRRGEALGMMLRNHKAEVIEVLAAVEGVPSNLYELKPDEVVLKLLSRACELSELVKALFPTHAQSTAGACSGRATENTGEGATQSCS